MTKQTHLSGVIWSCALLGIATTVFAQNRPTPADNPIPQAIKPVEVGTESTTRYPVLPAQTGAQQPMLVGPTTTGDP